MVLKGKIQINVLKKSIVKKIAGLSLSVKSEISLFTLSSTFSLWVSIASFDFLKYPAPSDFLASSFARKNRSWFI
jgi:hypothetical protein